MTTTPNDYLYLSQDDLYRFGNSNSPRLEHVRPTDVDLYEVNGVLHVRANGRGISLLTEEGAANKTRLAMADTEKHTHAARLSPQSRPARPLLAMSRF